MMHKVSANGIDQMCFAHIGKDTKHVANDLAKIEKQFRKHHVFSMDFCVVAQILFVWAAASKLWRVDYV